MAPLGRRFARAISIVVILLASSGRDTIGAASETTEYEDERRTETYRFMENFLGGRSMDEVADELVDMFYRTMDSEKLKKERKRREQKLNLETDDEALLERLATYVVRWINTRLTPRTDDECTWSWGMWRCDPQCDCRYKYRFGDYTPGRSCRLRDKENKNDQCDPEAGNGVSLLEKLGSFLAGKVKRAWRFTSEHVIPQTDEECRFAMAPSVEEKRIVCEPEETCSVQWKLGDVHFGRSCRLRKSENGLRSPQDTEAKSADTLSESGDGDKEVRGWFPGETFAEVDEMYD